MIIETRMDLLTPDQLPFFYKEIGTGTLSDGTPFRLGTDPDNMTVYLFTDLPHPEHDGHKAVYVVHTVHLTFSMLKSVTARHGLPKRDSPAGEGGRRCRGCGCTETRACATPGGPCYWVEPDLCSNCADAANLDAALKGLAIGPVPTGSGVPGDG